MIEPLRTLLVAFLEFWTEFTRKVTDGICLEVAVLLTVMNPYFQFRFLFEYSNKDRVAELAIDFP